MKILLGIIFCTLTCAPSALGQQTIFNVPSADVTDKGKIYLEHESQFRPWNPGRYWYGTDYFAYGFGATEGDITLYNLTVPRSHNASAGIGFKSALPIFTKRLSGEELRWTLGSQALVSLEGQGLGYWGYSHLSGKIPKTKTRLTAGISGGTKQLFGTSTIHFIGGIEQPLNKKVSFLADWYSGKHGLGFFTFGSSIAFPGSTTVFFGYQIPNDKRIAGRQGLTFELAKFF